RDHVPAQVELAARDRLDALVADAELSGIEGEHRGVAADRAGEQKFERRRRAILSAHMHGLADDELVSALDAVDELVELTDRGHLHLDKGLRTLWRRGVRLRAVARLARLGDRLELGETITDFGHALSPWTCRAAQSQPASC